MASALLLEVGAMFAAIGLVSFLASRTGLSPIPFYILTGIAVNEYVAGGVGLPAISESAFVQVGAELGVVFLLFFLGLEFNLDRLVADRDQMGRAGAVDFAVNFGVGLVLGVVLFEGLAAAVVFAGIVYISSSAVITKTMLDVGWIANPESGPLLGTLVFEDLVIAGYLAVVSALVLGGGSLGSAGWAVATAAAILLALFVLVSVGTPVLERMLETTSSEYFILRTVGTTVFIAGGALALGVSEAVAAFFVGMAFGPTRFDNELEVALSPIRDTFAAVFFFWIGLVTDPFAFLGVIDLVAIAVVVTTPTKLLSGYYGGQVYGLTARRSLRVGLGMVTRGEFSLIIAAAALTGADGVLGGGVAETIYAFTVCYVLVMSILGTLLMEFSGVIERAIVSP